MSTNATLQSSSARQTHQDLFTDYIIAGLHESLARVEAAEYVVPDADREQTWHLLSFALDVPAVWPETRELLLALAPKMELAGFREGWIPYLEKGWRSAQNLGDWETAAECELQLGLLYRLMSRFEEAHQWTTASVEHFALQNNAYKQASALNELAWLEHLQNDFEAATYHVEQALEFLTSKDLEYAVSFRVKGLIAMGQRRWQQAERFQRLSLELFQQFDDLRRIAWSQQNVGYALSEQGKLESAIDLYEQATASLYYLGDHYHWAIVQMNLGVAYYRRKQAKFALECHLAASKIFTQIGDTTYKARVATNLGLTHLELQDYTNSCYEFRNALQLYEVLGDEIWYINAMDGLAMALIASKEYEEATIILQRALKRLTKIKGTSYYESLNTMVTTHLQDAQQHKS